MQTTRDELIDFILDAGNFEEYEQAKKLLMAWMKEHPDDWGMLDAGGMLEMLTDTSEPPVKLHEPEPVPAGV